MFKTKTVVLSLISFLLGISVSLLVSWGFRQPPVAAALLKPEIILYSQPNFQGSELHLFGDAVDLPFEDLADGRKLLWNDNVASFIVVSGTWRLYQHGRMNTALDDTPRESLDVRTKSSANGWSSLISANSHGPLRISSPELAGIDFDISSVELVSAMNLPDWVYRSRQ